MRISLAATNPCHVYDMAKALLQEDALGTYYSGYPRWRLPGGEEMPLRAHSGRTLVTYALLKYVPPRWRPANRSLFLWQDRGFDLWVSRHLASCDLVHGIPGQCREIFRSARKAGIKTVLNHATGPVRQWVDLLRPEYERAGLDVTTVTPYDARYFEREKEEYGLADFHCAASTVVRDQLMAEGIEAERIWVVPYGADSAVFHARGRTLPSRFTVAFAGQIGLRKGLRVFLQALGAAGPRDWQVDLYGNTLPEAEKLLAGYSGAIPLHQHGAISRPALAEAFRSASVLVLPSIEEGFGLVVPQALSCGLPCIVSERVGARDLIKCRENGSIVAHDDPNDLLQELLWWEAHPATLGQSYDWDAPARRLVEYSHLALN